VRRPERVAIIGGGCSGALVAAELLRRARRALSIVVFEPRARLGRGPAYATPFPVHVLNVAADRLSGRDGEPDHFLAWLRRRVPQAGGSTFAPRGMYGTYLESLLASARASARPGVVLEHLQEDVVDLRPSGDALEVVLACAPPFAADRVVLAVGNLPPDTLARLAPDGDDPIRYVRDPWSPGALDFPDAEGDVLVLGTGLTAVDVILSLGHRGHQGRTVAVSRHGLLPRSHSAASTGSTVSGAGLSWDTVPPVTARGLVREVRQQSRRAAAVGGDWRSVVDSLRVQTQALWRALPPGERARFVRHVQPYWDVHRHRTPPEVDERVRATLRAGVLSVVAGRVERLRERGGSIEATIARRGGQPALVIEVRHVVDCTGPGPVGRTAHPLLRRLLGRGLVRPDGLGLGLDATPDGRLASEANPRGDRLFALGPLLRGALWETTAVAEIRGQAAHLAATLLSLAPDGGSTWPGEPSLRSA
jgi:uncharacterized NAD(P)/FAD-binding protein YdhS